MPGDANVIPRHSHRHHEHHHRRRRRGRTRTPMQNQTLFTSSGASLIGYKPGSKKVNQDCILTTSIVSETTREEVNGALLVVCDGHGEEGESISQYVAKRLCAEMMMSSYISTAVNGTGQSRRSTSSSTSQIEPQWNVAAKAITEALSTEDRFKHIAYSSGTTCVAAFLENNRRLTVANLGDSRCAVVSRRRRPGHVHFESIDHKPDSPPELERIRKAKGHYTTRKNDVPRVAGLALSRAFGDFHAAPHGVISEMEVTTIDLSGTEELENDDLWIVLGSDGIFDVFGSTSELGSFLVATEREIREERKDTTSDEEGNITKELCVRTASEARSRWLAAYRGQYVDDVSIVVGSLKRPFIIGNGGSEDVRRNGVVSLGSKL